MFLPRSHPSISLFQGGQWDFDGMPRRGSCARACACCLATTWPSRLPCCAKPPAAVPTCPALRHAHLLPLSLTVQLYCLGCYTFLYMWHCNVEKMSKIPCRRALCFAWSPAARCASMTCSPQPAGYAPRRRRPPPLQPPRDRPSRLRCFQATLLPKVPHHMSDMPAVQMLLHLHANTFLNESSACLCSMLQQF